MIVILKPNPNEDQLESLKTGYWARAFKST